MLRDNKNRSTIMITAPASNSGKTAITCGLISLMKKRGKDVCAFKCGPDYIDPMFHRSVLGVESHNLDAFLAGEKGVRRIYERNIRNKDAVIVEGVMGYYDGLGGGLAKASPWHISTMLHIPSVLVIRPKGAALSLAALIRGFAGFRCPSGIAAVIFNDCSKGFYDRYAGMIEEESGVPVAGYLPHMEEADFGSRHLGLMTAGEIEDIRERIDRISCVMEDTVDIKRLEEITGCNEAAGKETDRYAAEEYQRENRSVKIAVARDDAFNFIYEEAVEDMKSAGADIVFFSPMEDEKLPGDACGLYIPGGYPELYGEKLSSNKTMLDSIRDSVKMGMPTIAECGGFMYLGKRIEDSEGRSWDMTGVLEGESHNTGRLVRFGYGNIMADKDSMLFRAGEKIPVHEFHYWDTTDRGSDLELEKASDGRRYAFGYCSDSLYAGFPHLYMSGEIDLAGRFVAAATAYEQRMNTGK